MVSQRAREDTLVPPNLRTTRGEFTRMANRWPAHSRYTPCMLAFLLACAAPETYPEGLEPLEDNTADWPKATDDEEYPETVEIKSGEEDDYDWAHARGYVHAGMLPTWDVLQNPDVGVDRRRVDEWTVTEDTDKDYSVSYTVNNVVHDVITIDFDVAWIEDVARGTDELPTAIAGRWEVVEPDGIIVALAGSFVLIYEAPDVSGLELIYHLNTAQRDPENPPKVMQDMYDSVVAVAAGDDLPVYEEE